MAQACAYLCRHRLSELGGFGEFGEKEKGQKQTNKSFTTFSHFRRDT